MEQEHREPAASSDLADRPGDTLEPDAVTTAEAKAVPYEFDATHVAAAVAVVDDAFAKAADSWDACSAIMQMTMPADIVAAASLQGALLHTVTYSLRLAPRGRKAGCSLDPGESGEGNDWLPAIRAVPDPVVKLWRQVAAGVTAPGAIAHFEDLLFCRRDGNGHQRAARAGEAYLAVVQGRDVNIAETEMLVRAWTLARSVRNSDLDDRARAAMFTAASGVMAAHPGGRPGIVLPILAALAVGPLHTRGSTAVEPFDVDGLLVQAAGRCHDGLHASESHSCDAHVTRTPP